MSRLDWERYKTKEGLRAVVLVWIVCVSMYFAAVFIGYLLSLTIDVGRWVYLADMVEITVDIFTTATGVVWGLSLFFLFLRSLLEVEEKARREAFREDG